MNGSIITKQVWVTNAAALKKHEAPNPSKKITAIIQ
jgi:hypothetical protein